MKAGCHCSSARCSRLSSERPTLLGILALRSTLGVMEGSWKVEAPAYGGARRTGTNGEGGGVRIPPDRAPVPYPQPLTPEDTAMRTIAAAAVLLAGSLAVAQESKSVAYHFGTGVKHTNITFV